MKTTTIYLIENTPKKSLPYIAIEPLILNTLLSYYVVLHLSINHKGKNYLKNTSYMECAVDNIYMGTRSGGEVFLKEKGFAG